MEIDFSRFYDLLNKSFWGFFKNKSRIRISYGGGGSGKCFGKGTRIIMYSGYLKNVEDIVVGDILMGPDSKPRTVLETHFGESQLYLVKQNKGIDYVVNDNHILSLKKSEYSGREKGTLFPSGKYRRPNGRYNKDPEIINIEIKEYLLKSKRWKENFTGYRSKIEFKEKEIKLDPYFLGIWLGDGSSKGTHITTEDKEIVDFIYDFANKNKALISIDEKLNNNAKTYKIVYGGKSFSGSNLILDRLRFYNLINNKYIPDNYLYNSRENRLQLLAGLIDTDGSLQGNCYDFIQKNKYLSEQIKFLCNSLGFRCEIKPCKKSCLVNGLKFTGDYYRMNISGNIQDIPVKIERKKIINFNKNKNTYITGIKIEDYGIGKYYGFEVDKDHLFMIEDCTVVHNSVEAFQECIYKLVVQDGHNYLICRKVAATNKTSTYALMVQLINEMNLNSVFKVNKTDMSVTCIRNGNMAIFKGLDDIEKIKSITFPRGILTDIIIEEASEITQKDFNQLNVRLRGRAKVPFQITMLLNPINDQHWIKREFFDLQSYQKKYKVRILKTTYKDNKFIDDEYREVLEGYKDIDFEFYKVYCLGEWGSFGNIIFNNWQSLPCPYKESDFDVIYNGMDFGFEHPSVIVKIGFKDGAMYTYNEVCCEKKTNMEFIEINAEYDVLHKGETCRGDSAEPARIKEWVQAGYGVIGAIKGPDSVSRGIDFMKTQKWFIDPDKCPRTLQEAQVYHYKTDKNGNVDIKENPTALFDDAIKSHMYALEPLSRSQGKPGVLSGSISDQKKELIQVKREQRKKMKQALTERRKERKLVK